jgi:acyl carrier protein
MTDVEQVLITHVLATRETPVEPDTDLVAQQIFDSIGFIDLLAWVEERFGVSFAADEIEAAFVTVAKIAAAVAAKRGI